MRGGRETECDVKAPISTLVVLRGYDSSAKQADELARELDPEARWHHVSPEGPVAVSEDTRAWFDIEVTGSVADAVVSVRSILRSIIDDGGVDPAGIVLVGYSQGA